MIAQLDAIHQDALAAIADAHSETDLEEFRIRFLGKKGALTQVAAEMRNVSKEDKPAVGQKLNDVRQAINTLVEDRDAALLAAKDAEAAKGIDTTLPGRRPQQAALHPLTQMMDRGINALRQMGFTLAAGPEVETEFHCFDALNTPEDHPARNEKDTFYFHDGHLLRTHTSSVQVRTMETTPPPVRIIAPGSAYRRDEIDSTHLSVFTQMEGLYVAEDVSVGDLKGTLERLFRAIFGPKTPVRFRPHFFPFTEPSFEIDIKLQPKGQDPRWIEIAGCGMVDPNVFTQICQSRGDDHYDPDKVTGFAFGLGLERLAMIMWGIPDIRWLIENDQRFLRQFA
ncbi:MAG: phenylalanyl-tRNA synthetase alpha chain [Verrucomicrobiales bacterium]|jgi:phenylalanyl-tRNA synthetase alpha chain